MAESSPDSGLDAVKSRATASAVWTALGFGGRQAIRLGANLILTRLLFEELFGLMALISVVILGVQLFADIGVNAVMIQGKREDPDFANTMWTIDIVRSIILWFITLGVAQPVARFYEEPSLGLLIPVAAIGGLIRSFGSTNFYIARRHLLMKQIITLEVVAQIVGTVVMVIWAWITPTVWALVGGGLVTALVTSVWTWVGLPGPGNRLHFEREAALELYRFGRWILLSTLLMFLVTNGDRLIFGKLVTMSVLGVYNIALNLALLPSAAMKQLSMSVIFPLYSRLQHGSELDAAYRSVRLPMLVIGGWVTSGMIAGGPAIVDVLYDPRYVEAGWMLQFLVAGAWFGVAMEGSNGVALLALGHSRWMALASAVKLVGMLVFIPLGWHFGGFVGALFGFAAADVTRYLTSLLGVRHFGLKSLDQDVQLTLMVVGSSFLGWMAVKLVRDAGLTNEFAHAAIVFAVVTLVWMPQLLRLWRRYRDTGQLFFAEESTPATP